MFSCLPLGGEATDRAASALGKAVSRMADEHIEEARNVVRRLMWHMNEESGNIGWGIPEAFAEILAQHRRLGEFYPILNSYVIDTGKGDNFCDNNVLRRSCFRAVERFALARPSILRPRPGVRFRPVCATKIPFAAKSPEKRWARSACFRGSGWGNGIEGGGEPFSRKVPSPPPNLLPPPFQRLSTLSNPSCRVFGREKGFPLLGKLFYT